MQSGTSARIAKRHTYPKKPSTSLLKWWGGPSGKALPGLLCLSDAGSEFPPISRRERLAEIDTVLSIGTVGNSFDNSLAETVNWYYTAEHVRGAKHCGHWKITGELALAALDGVHWRN